ncbi:hypothetical protein [Aggregatilinea lenta]|uniref:hypothetical protein n=1 Tax=Aggregatilinea lenta TaxID=913108 RepID=UPI000E5C5026|nr:hypothetical protein [Aggregatilinea lenta]
MSNGTTVACDPEPEETPRVVYRGVKHQLTHIGLDSVYFNVDYPYDDVFRWWMNGVGDEAHPALYTGVPVDDCVIRRGAHGYKLSVWDGDARLYLTDRVNYALRGTKAEGQGMGMMLQLGPKWLHQYGQPFAENLLRDNVYAQLTYFGVHNPEQYPIRIIRLDTAVDVLNLATRSFSLDTWRLGWVGAAKLRNYYFDSRSGDLTGFNIGSHSGNLCLTVYNKVLEAERDGDLGFWRSVWGVDENDDIDVTRFEWSARPYQARFSGLRFLSNYNYESYLGLLNYAVGPWGRLCIPEADRNHSSRWQVAPLWAELCSFITDWGVNYEYYVRPEYNIKPDLTLAYLNSGVGWIAGLQARIGLELGLVGPATLEQVMTYLEREGYTLQEIDRRALKKWELFSRLARGHQDA